MPNPAPPWGCNARPQFSSTIVAKVVGDDHLQEEAADAEVGAFLHHPQSRTAAAVDLVLVEEVPRADDRPRHQVRKERQEEEKTSEPALGRDATPVDVHDVADHLEGVEGDAERQRQLDSGRRDRWHARGRGDEDDLEREVVEVFEEAEHAEPGDDRRDDRPPAAPCARRRGADDTPGDVPHHRHGAEEQHVPRRVPRVEGETRAEEERGPRAMRPRAIEQHAERQYDREEKRERERDEAHADTTPPGVAGRSRTDPTAVKQSRRARYHRRGTCVKAEACNTSVWAAPASRSPASVSAP
jgi:hypothetical protein